MEPLVDAVDGPVFLVQMENDYGIEGASRVEDAILRDRERVLRLGERHMAGDAQREHLDPGRIRLLAVDDLSARGAETDRVL